MIHKWSIASLIDFNEAFIFTLFYPYDFHFLSTNSKIWSWYQNLGPARSGSIATFQFPSDHQTSRKIVNIAFQALFWESHKPMSGFCSKFQKNDSKARPFSSSGLYFRRKTQKTNLELKVDWICPETPQKLLAQNFQNMLTKKGAWNFSVEPIFQKGNNNKDEKSFEKWEKSCSSAEIWPILVTRIPKRVPEWSYRTDTSSKWVKQPSKV